MAQYPVEPEAFVVAWQKARTIAEAAEELKMPKSVVAARAAAYRQMGIALKKMARRVAPSLNIEKLNGLIADINKEIGLPPPTPSPKPKTLGVEQDEIKKNIKGVLGAIHEVKGKKAKA